VERDNWGRLPGTLACYNLLAVGGEKTEDEVESREKSHGIFGEMRFLYIYVYIHVKIIYIIYTYRCMQHKTTKTIR